MRVVPLVLFAGCAGPGAAPDTSTPPSDAGCAGEFALVEPEEPTWWVEVGGRGPQLVTDYTLRSPAQEVSIAASILGPDGQTVFESLQTFVGLGGWTAEQCVGGGELRYWVEDPSLPCALDDQRVERVVWLADFHAGAEPQELRSAGVLAVTDDYRARYCDGG
jgi:hypothetical protein